MVSFAAVCTAFCQYASGIFIFKKPEIINLSATWLAGLTALLAECLVLWSIPLYPKKLRKLVPIGSYLFDYLASTFLIEYYMANFWFPLEAAVMSIPAITGRNVETSLVVYNSNFEYLSTALTQESTAIVVDHFLSFTTLIMAMHATRMINLSLLRRGVRPFLCDAKKNLERFHKSNVCPYVAAIPFIWRQKMKQRDEDEDLDEDGDEDGNREERKSIEFKDYDGDDDNCVDLPQMPTREYYNIFRRR